jgi:hypothetical protein
MTLLSKKPEVDAGGPHSEKPAALGVPSHEVDDTWHSRPSSHGSDRGPSDAGLIGHAAAGLQPWTAPTKRQFPPAFALYRLSKLGSKYQLGESQNAPVFGVSTKVVWTSSADVILHDGPDPKTAGSLAEVELKTLSADMRVKLPDGKVHEADCHGFMQHRWTFGMDTGCGRREDFEWRHSGSDEVKDLGGKSKGYKLVALSRNDEVVMVYARSGMGGGSKEARFEFLGSGASGVLGEAWAVVAVATALGIIVAEKRKKRAAAGAASAGGSG